MSFPGDIEISSGQLKRFIESVIDSKCLLKVEAASFFVLIQFILFKQHIFLHISIFISEIPFTCFLKWFEITIKT